MTVALSFDYTSDITEFGRAFWNACCDVGRRDIAFEAATIQDHYVDVQLFIQEILKRHPDLRLEFPDVGQL